MELKTKEDFVKAFLSVGKKYGMAQYEGYPKNSSHSFCNEIPEDLGDNKLYLVEKTTYEKGDSFVEHVTETWNHSEEDYEPCDPYDKLHCISYEITTKPVFAFFVKPSVIANGKIYHFVTGISGTQYNQRYGEWCEPYSGSYYDVWHNNSAEKFTTHTDCVQCRLKLDSAYNSGTYNKPVAVDTHVYYQKGKLFAKYVDYGNGHESEVELTGEWRAFTTYEEVLEFQKNEEKRLKELQDKINMAEVELNHKLESLLKNAKEVVEAMRDFNKLSKSRRSTHTSTMEYMIKEYSNFDYFSYKWFKGC